MPGAIKKILEPITASAGRIAVFFFLIAISCSKPQRTVVWFWHVMNGPTGRQLDAMIADFNALHPEGEIRSVSMGSYDILAQKLMAAVASNSTPAIAQMYESWTDQFYRAGYLCPMDSFIEIDSGFNMMDIYPVFVEDNTFDSVIVTLPFNKSVPVFYYNADMLEEVGFDSFPENWQEFRTLCEALHRKRKIATSWPVDAWYFSTMLFQEGGDLYDDRTQQAQFQSSAGVRILRYLVDLVKDSLLYINPGFQRQDEFLAGNVATIPASIVSWSFMKGRPSFRMGVAPFPAGRSKAAVIAGTNIGLFRKTTALQKELAWAFIKWFLEPVNQARWTRATYYLPVRRSTAELAEFQEFIDQNTGYRRVMEQLEVGRTEPRTSVWFAGRIYLNEALEEALRLERAPDQVLDNAAKRMALERR